MSALAQLRTGRARRGRGDLSDESRQLRDEMGEEVDRVRRAVLELDGAAASARRCFITGTCRRSDASLFYMPFGSTAEALAGGVDAEVLLTPPFGANTRIVEVQFVCEVSAGSTVVTIRDADETIVATETVASVVLDDIFTATFNYDWTDGATKIIGVDPTVNPTGFRMSVVFEEVDS